MELTVTGLDAAPTKFKHLFGRYIKGFKPWTHCDRCFETNHATAIVPSMKDGAYQLEDRLFYLCGVGQDVTKSEEKLHPESARRHTNVHLAVVPRKGSIAAAGSVYGVSFTIRDAEAIHIKTVPLGTYRLSEVHTNCKMFQLGHQLFQVDNVDPEHVKVQHGPTT